MESFDALSVLEFPFKGLLTETVERGETDLCSFSSSSSHAPSAPPAPRVLNVVDLIVNDENGNNDFCREKGLLLFSNWQ